MKMENRAGKFPALFLYVIFFLSPIAWTLVNRCEPGQIPCDEHNCVSNEKWCDGEEDCSDGSDENYCKMVHKSRWGPLFSDPDPNECASTHHLCGSGICYPKSVVCDDFGNCKDYSDENNCVADESLHTAERLDESDINPTPDSTVTSTMDYSGESEEQPTTTNTPDSHQFDTRVLATPEPEITPDPSSTTRHAYNRNNIEQRSSNRNHQHGDNTHYPNSRNGGNHGSSSRVPVHQVNYDHYHQTHTYPSRSRSQAPSYNPRNPASQVQTATHTHSQHTGRQDSQHPPQVNPNRVSLHPNHNIRSFHNDRHNRYIPSITESVFSGIRKSLPRFNFPSNYHQEYAHLFEYNVRRGRDWIKEQRHQFDGWGKDTPRALVALSLIDNSFLNTGENSMMKKQFDIYLGFNLLRNYSSSSSISPSKMASFVNALIATCQDPRNFHGVNLVEELRKRVGGPRRFVNPFIYLTLCLADVPPLADDLNKLNMMLMPSFPGQESAKDMQILAISALACYVHQSSLDSSFNNNLRVKVTEAADALLARKLSDGSFGSLYSTSLALQALFAINTTNHWDPKPSLEYLAKQQLEDGSFGDFLATYYALPVLSGRGLVHLRNTQCGANETEKEITPSEILDHLGPKQHIMFSIYLGSPVENSYSVSANVPNGTSIFDIMRVAEYLNDRFRFTYEIDERTIYVNSISGIPNDSILGLHWQLYIKTTSLGDENSLRNAERVVTDIRRYYPREGEHVIFWYH